MSWISIYDLALRLLPEQLRSKHAEAMRTLFARELERARAWGRVQEALTGAGAVADLLRRATYERFRQRPTPTSAPPLGAPLMSLPTTGALLRRHALSFVTAFLAITLSLLIVYASRQLPALDGKGATLGTMLEALLLAVPFTAALTIPMAVLIAVLHEFTRLGANGTLDAARATPRGIRRLVVPVIGAAIGVAALALALTAEVIPRSNARLQTLIAGSAATHNDRTMTIPELQRAAQRVRTDTEPTALARVAAYEVEVQKKFALPAACVVMALVGLAIAVRVPRGGNLLVIAASLMVFALYYVMLVTGEQLADRLVVSPLVGMWGANAFLVAAALLVLWIRRAPSGSRLVARG